MKSLLFVVTSLCIYTTAAQRLIPNTIPCVNDETCKSIVNPSQNFKCLNYRCMCVSNTGKEFEPCSNQDVIVGATLKGGLKRNCTSNADCEHIEGAKCYEVHEDNSTRICDCQPHMVMGEDGQKCLSVAVEPGAKCTEHVQCTAKLDGAECHDGQCRCRPNFHFAASSKRCVLDKVYGESCKREEESCYQLASADGLNALGCSEQNLCVCLKKYSFREGNCQLSGASQFKVSFILAVITLITTITVF